ncbi:hypothetical protein BJY52DRAFT_1192126 [Lactarius psammicola]|nr:hypothetical protein BJY52DRAFT_1192126 [Lactarius psammicola]
MCPSPNLSVHTPPLTPARAAETILSPNTPDGIYTDVGLPLEWSNAYRDNVERPRRTSASLATTTALANCAALGPLPSDWEMRMTLMRRIYVVGPAWRGAS